jgi:hypothetical protein
MRRFVTERALGLVLFALFVASWAAQAIAQIGFEHEGWPAFWAATFENWQSEFLQLASFVILAKYLIYRGSPQSRDGDDDTRTQLDRIERRLEEVGR